MTTDARDPVRSLAAERVPEGRFKRGHRSGSSSHSTETSEELVRQELHSTRADVVRVPVGRTLEPGESPSGVRTEGGVTIIPVSEEIVIVEKRLVWPVVVAPFARKVIWRAAGQRGLRHGYERRRFQYGQERPAPKLVPSQEGQSIREEVATADHPSDLPTPSQHSIQSLWKLTLGSIGLVYGDIGTSPIYGMRDSLHAASSDGLSRADVIGVISLLIWALILAMALFDRLTHYCNIARCGTPLDPPRCFQHTINLAYGLSCLDPWSSS